MSKQIKYINAESLYIKRGWTTGEAVLSWFTTSLLVKRKSHSLWDVFVKWPHGKLFFFLDLLAWACCIHIPSKENSSSSSIKVLPMLLGEPGQSNHTLASVWEKLGVEWIEMVWTWVEAPTLSWQDSTGCSMTQAPWHTWESRTGWQSFSHSSLRREGYWGEGNMLHLLKSHNSAQSFLLLPSGIPFLEM